MYLRKYLYSRLGNILRVGCQVEYDVAYIYESFCTANCGEGAAQGLPLVRSGRYSYSTGYQYCHALNWMLHRHAESEVILSPRAVQGTCHLSRVIQSVVHVPDKRKGVQKRRDLGAGCMLASENLNLF